MKYEIRPLDEGDADLLWEKADEIWPSAEGAEEELFVFKAVDGRGSVLGGCVLDIDLLKNAEFNSLWVDERYRRSGIGSALIREAERCAFRKGCRSILNAYNFDFQHARPLFEKQGYRLAGIIRNWPKGHECYALIKDPEDLPEESGSADHNRFRVVPGTEKDGELITDALERYNASAAPRSHPYLDNSLKITDENGRMIAGCIAGVSGWDTLHIDMIFTDEAYRNQGFGSFLLAQTERQAKEKGAYLSRTDAAQPQAEFFGKHGYLTDVIYEGTPDWHVLRKYL